MRSVPGRQYDTALDTEDGPVVLAWIRALILAQSSQQDPLQTQGHIAIPAVPQTSLGPRKLDRNIDLNLVPVAKPLLMNNVIAGARLPFCVDAARDHFFVF